MDESATAAVVKVRGHRIRCDLFSTRSTPSPSPCGYGIHTSDPQEYADHGMDFDGGTEPQPNPPPPCGEGDPSRKWMTNCYNHAVI